MKNETILGSCVDLHRIALGFRRLHRESAGRSQQHDVKEKFELLYSEEVRQGK